MPGGAPGGPGGMPGGALGGPGGPGAPPAGDVPPTINVQMDLNAKFGWRRDGETLNIKSVTAGSQSEQVGIQPGWEIVALNGMGVQNAQNLNDCSNYIKSQGNPICQVTLKTNGVPPLGPGGGAPGAPPGIGGGIMGGMLCI